MYQPWACVVGVAGHAVCFLQLLVESYFCLGLDNLLAQTGAQANVVNCVAAYTQRGGCTAQRHMTGEAVGGNCGMSFDNWPGGHHQVWIDKCQRYKSQKVDGNDYQNPGPLHFQPQNRKTEKM